MDTSAFLPIQFAMMFLASLIIIAALAVALDHLVKAVVAFVTKAFEGRWWRPLDRAVLS